MSKFRKRPVVIEAVQWVGDIRHVADLFARSGLEAIETRRSDACLYIPTLEGTMIANKGDWIIFGVKGELYPCKLDIFAETYEPVEGDA